MNRVLRSGVALLFLSALAMPRAAWAQAGGMSFNGAAGLALPTGSFGDFADLGYNLTLGVGLTQHASPLAFRGEAMYNEFNNKFDDGKTFVSGLTANAIYNFSTSIGNPVVPYAIGGVGYYLSRVSGFDNESNVGWNIGAGVRFPLSGFSAYIEARYHSAGGDTQFAPVVFGVVF